MQEIDFFNATKVALQLEEREHVPWWFPKFYKAVLKIPLVMMLKELHGLGNNRTEGLLGPLTW